MSTPGTTPAAAADIARRVLGESIADVNRFSGGAANFVYDVTTGRGTRVVVRISRDRSECAGGVYWSRILRPLAVPLPRMIAHHVPEDDAAEGECAWTVLERFRGTDLENAYVCLSAGQKLAILDHVMNAQAITQALPRGSRFGFMRSLEPALYDSWIEVLRNHLARSQLWIEQVGAVDRRWVDRVRRIVEQEDFGAIEPIAFLDDTTTRNVIVDEGVFQGIVDVDGICYGDPLLVPALTRMALLNRGGDTFYTDAWIGRLDLSPVRYRHFQIYTALFALNFLAEQGQQFNLDAPPSIDPAEVQWLEGILDRLLQPL